MSRVHFPLRQEASIRTGVPAEMRYSPAKVREMHASHRILTWIQWMSTAYYNALEVANNPFVYAIGTAFEYKIGDLSGLVALN